MRTLLVDVDPISEATKFEVCRSS